MAKRKDHIHDPLYRTDEEGMEEKSMSKQHADAQIEQDGYSSHDRVCMHGGGITSKVAPGSTLFWILCPHSSSFFLFFSHLPLLFQGKRWFSLRLFLIQCTFAAIH
mmetsp:Transcript_33043/g.65509  ORF Transcript_33043/g.65509 Transcript_33043/m.65509 type:complete len:106 (+) Transcript_33043:141-458(+)